MPLRQIPLPRCGQEPGNATLATDRPQATCTNPTDSANPPDFTNPTDSLNPANPVNRAIATGNVSSIGAAGTAQADR